MLRLRDSNPGRLVLTRYRRTNSTASPRKRSPNGMRKRRMPARKPRSPTDPEHSTPGRGRNEVPMASWSEGCVADIPCRSVFCRKRPHTSLAVAAAAERRRCAPFLRESDHSDQTRPGPGPRPGLPRPRVHRTAVSPPHFATVQVDVRPIFDEPRPSYKRSRTLPATGGSAATSTRGVGLR